MPTKLEIYSDFVCPFCLLAKAPLEEALRGLEGVEVEWMPFELRPFPTPTLRPEDPYLPQIWAQSVYPMARQLGVEIKLPTVSPQPYTHLAFEGYQHAKTFGKEVANAYNSRMLQAFFRKIATSVTLKRCANWPKKSAQAKAVEKHWKRGATKKRIRARYGTRRKLECNQCRRS